MKWDGKKTVKSLFYLKNEVLTIKKIFFHTISYIFVWIFILLLWKSMNSYEFIHSVNSCHFQYCMTLLLNNLNYKFNLIIKKN